MVRMIPIVIGHKQVTQGVLDDTETWTYEVVRAHVTEVNGAQVQTNLFGKQFNMTWVARIHGNVKADSVSFMQNGVPDDKLEKMKVIQVRKHATRTDIYFSSDMEVNANGLE
ncbi:hypothetical protein [Limosilactobacillus frumenti]|nr:hypothetical protein [Limosilactobacillus frumenti]